MSLDDERAHGGDRRADEPDDAAQPHYRADHEPAPMPEPVRRRSIGKTLINGALIGLAVLLVLWLLFG